MRILFIDSGIGGIAERYAYDIFSTLLHGFVCQVQRVHPRQLTRERIRAFRPDVVLVVHGTLTPTTLIRYANDIGAVTVLWLVEDPYEIDYHRGEMIEPYQVIFTNERQAVAEYEHPRVYYLPWCCNPRVHRCMTVPLEYHSDLCFVGMGFANRLGILNALAAKLSKLKLLLIGDWEKWGELHPSLKRFVIPTITNYWDVQKYYNGAKINLNIHRDPVDPPSGNRRGIPATSPNDRVFSLAGCGAFQLVDGCRPDIGECFGIGREIETFVSPDGLWEMIQRYLKDSESRVQMAKAARVRAYRDHTFARRLSEMFRIIKKPLVQRRANDRQPVPGAPDRGWVFKKDFTPQDIYLFPKRDLL